MSRLKTAGIFKATATDNIYKNPNIEEINDMKKEFPSGMIIGTTSSNEDLYTWSNDIALIVPDEVPVPKDNYVFTFMNNFWIFRDYNDKYTPQLLKQIIIKNETKLSQIGELNSISIIFNASSPNKSEGNTSLSEIKNSIEGGTKMSRLKTAKVKDLGKIDKVDMDELKKIWGGFKFKYNDVSYQFSKVFTDDGPDYEVKIDGEAKVLKEFDTAINYLEKNIKENKKENKKVANHVSPFMHEEVMQHIISEPSGIRSKVQQSSMAFVIAKDLMAALPLVPANEVLYNLVQDIEAGHYDDISTLEDAEKEENWEAWKERTKEILIAKGLLVKTSRLRVLSEEKLTIEKVKELAKKNYQTGGDVIIECWDDKDIQEFIDDNSTIEKLMKMFKIYDDKYKDMTVDVEEF